MECTGRPSWVQDFAKRRSPLVQRILSLPSPGKGEGVGFTVATPYPIPPDEGMGFAGVVGRPPVAGFSRSRRQSRPVLISSLGLGRIWAACCSSSRPPEVGSLSVVLRGAGSPDVLKGYGPRVSLPAAHCSDIHLVSFAPWCNPSILLLYKCIHFFKRLEGGVI